MKKLSIIIIGIIIIASSCTEKVNIKLDNTYTRLVVYGYLTTDSITHYVKLNKTTSYYYDEPAPIVPGAQINLSDDDGNSVLLSEDVPGTYSIPPEFHAVSGRSYFLKIDLQEAIDGNKTYTASTAPVSQINPIDSIGLLYHADWGKAGFYEVQCYYKDPPSKDFYMFNIFRNDIWLTDTITKRFVTDDLFYNGNYTNGIGVGYLNQYDTREKLQAGDVVTFQGCDISESYYNFIVALQTEAGFQTPLFSGPPANVKGNISNGAVGYFAAYSVAYASKVFQP